ncbi:MAG: FtsW/RodA/SpoVE family cell cycle protein [Chloroflexi bacterium]|nr:FtsW/RodA/SpoVE family cell cycle protein [Chloroflexota bacterium]
MTSTQVDKPVPIVRLVIGSAGGGNRWLLLALAAVFVFAGLASVAVTRPSQGDVWLTFALWLAGAAGATLILKLRLPAHDPLLLALPLFLSGWGLVAIERLAPSFADRQALWLVISVLAMLAVASFPHPLRWLRSYRYSLLAAALLLLLATIALGRNPSGFEFAPRLWLSFGSFYFQPSELMKVILVAFMATYLAEQTVAIRAGSEAAGGDMAASPRLIGPMLLMWLLSMVVLVWQRDLGTAMLFFIVFMILLYLASGDRRIIIGGVALILVAGLAAYHLFDVVQLRVDIWLNPWPEADGRAYQIVQSLMAFGAGGIFGAGVAQGYPGYIPVVHSDFVFAAIAEEWGLLGVIGILSCLGVLAWRGLSIALTHPGAAFHKLLAVAITMTLLVQALMIMAGVLKLLPLTGVTLPFISYGGSSLLACHVMIGLLLRLSTGAR